MNSPEIRTIADRPLVVAQATMSLSENKTRELWQGFRPRVRDIENRIGDVFYSIQHLPEGFKMADFNPKTTFTKYAGVEVDSHANTPDGLGNYNLAGGQYAVFIHHGPAAAFAKTFQYIYGVWLPQSEYQLDTRDQFEKLGPSYRPDDPNAEEEVWIPIK